MFIKYQKGFSLIELLIVIVLIGIISVVAFINFGNQTPKARNAMRLDASSKIQTAFQISNLEEKIPSSSCLSGSSEYTLSGTISGTGCHISLNGSQESKNFLNNLKITGTFQDPLNETKGNDDFLYEFNYKLGSSQQEFVYLTEPTSNKSSFIQTNALNYQSGSLNELHIDGNFPNIEKSISPIYLKDISGNIISEIQNAVKTENKNGKDVIISFTNSETLKNKILSFSNIKFNQSLSKNNNVPTSSGSVNNGNSNPVDTGNTDDTDTSSGENVNDGNGSQNPSYPFGFVNDDFTIWDGTSFRNPSPENCFNFNLIDNNYYEISKSDVECNLTELVIPRVYNNKPIRKIADNGFKVVQKYSGGFCMDSNGNQYPELTTKESCETPPFQWMYENAYEDACFLDGNLLGLFTEEMCQQSGGQVIHQNDDLCKNHETNEILLLDEYSCDQKNSIKMFIQDILNMNESFAHKLVLPNGIQYIGYNAFQGISNKYQYVFNDLIIPDSVISIGDSAFETSGIKTVKFGENSNLSYLGEYSFAYNNLNSINIPVNVSEIKNYAFFSTNSIQDFKIQFLRNDLTKTYSQTFRFGSDLTNLSNKNENLFGTWILNSGTFVKQ